MKIVGAIYEKIEMYFFLCELPLILGVGEKKGSRCLQEDPRYQISTISVDWFRLYDRRRTTDGRTDGRTDGQTDREPDRGTDRHIFRLKE